MTILIGMPGGSEWILVLAFLGLTAMVPLIFYCATLQNTLRSISFENRKMPAGNVWLLLIPLFGTIWHFVVINNLADSIKAEATSRNMILDEQRPAYNVGLAMCILNCLWWIPSLIILTGPAALICWIVYWVKISTYKNRIVIAGRVAISQQ